MDKTSRQAEVAAIHAAEAAYDTAWSAGDLDSILGCLTRDAVIVNPRGEVAAGMDEIREELSAFLRGPAKGSTHTSVLTRVSFISDDVAVVDGHAIIDGLQGSGSRSVRHSFVDILVRRNDRWLIAHVRAYGLSAHVADG